MKASEIKLQRILEGTQQYMVPLFQRHYSWEKQHWEVLWEDLKDLTEQETMKPHFMGAIVTMQMNSVPEGVNKFLLIDGQQRLTTVLILLAVVRDHAKGDETTARLAEQINNTILLNFYNDGLERYKLQPTQSDRLAFHEIIDEKESTEDSLIKECYKFYNKKLRYHKKIDLSTIKNAIVSGLSVVSITLDTDENPHLVFESLNAKGKPLTQADLIRNFFFMKIDVNQQEEIHQKYWQPMQTALKDDLTEYIRHYLMKQGSEVKKDQIYFILKDKINPQNALESLQDLTKFAQYYKKFIAPQQETDPSIRYYFQRLQRLNVTTVYPFLLNCYADYADEELSRLDFLEILKIIENFIIRRYVCARPSNYLNKVFPSLYNQITQQIEGDFLSGLKNALSGANQYPGDETFKSHLVELDFYGRGRVQAKAEKAKLILESIEQSFNHKEAVSFEKLTIEHIMPQKLNEAWKQHLGEDGRVVHELLVNTLGNLTLTAYNSELRDNSFAAKKNILVESHLELNRYFQGKTTWQQADIEKRAAYLAGICLQIWPHFGDDTQNNVVENTFRGTKPKILHFLDKQYSVNSWRDVLENTMNVLADIDEDKLQELIDNYPRLINWHSKKFRDSRQLKNKAFIEVNLSADNIHTFCLKAIEQFDLTTENWRVEKT